MRDMSVAKPILEYIKGIRVQLDMQRSIKAFKRIAKYTKPYIHLIILIIILSSFRSYLFTLEPLYTAQIIDKVIVANDYDLLVGLLTKIFLAVAGFGILNFTVIFINSYMAKKIVQDIRTDYYNALQEKSFEFHDSAAVGDLISRATMDLQPVDAFIAASVGTICDAIFTAVAVSLIMTSINPILSIISVFPILLTFYFNVGLFTKSMPLFRRMQLILGRIGAYIQQDIIGMKNVRIFKREDEMEDGFKQVEALYVATAVSAGRVQSVYTPAAEATLSLGVTLIYIYGANLVVSPAALLTIGDLILFTRYMRRLTNPLKNLSQLIGQWVNASAGFERVTDMIDAPVDIEEQPDARDIKIEVGNVEFKDVEFGYTKNLPVLRNINMSVQPGEKIAILGATGSGKTSLIYLIPRFYDTTRGSITIDGNDLREFKLSSLRKQIGLVLQDVFLFSGTMRDNIAFGKPDASLEEVMTAAKLAQIHDFIDSLPEKYDTTIGERGVTLSGGQKQRVTIARTLLTNPKILILDDSLSFVDAKTEHDIQQAIEEAMKGRTTFMIAQRLSTIKNADRIMVLDNGEIVEFGSHDDLMTKNGIYRKIYETQFLEKAPEEILGTVA
jgi:ABC-type multidrug transport system fused ATPase/permease subunit